jgi:hypothetical protein
VDDLDVATVAVSFVVCGDECNQSILNEYIADTALLGILPSNS